MLYPLADVRCGLAVFSGLERLYVGERHNPRALLCPVEDLPPRLVTATKRALAKWLQSPFSAHVTPSLRARVARFVGADESAGEVAR